MAVIFHVLKEECERLIETEAAYAKAIAAMPQGTPHVRQLRKKSYLYLQHRKGKRVIHDYVGPADGEKAKEMLEKIDQRKRYEKLLKETRSALNDVRKALRGKI
jgi:hypothetical protein